MELAQKKELYLRACKEYEKGTPIISDGQFNDLEQELLRECPEWEPLQSVWSEDKEEFSDLDILLKQYPMRSIEPIFKEDKIRTFEPVLEDGIELNYSIKDDGQSLRAVYIYGDRKKATTRGRETVGLEVANNTKYIFPEHIDKLAKYAFVEIRGEDMIRIKDMDVLRSTYPSKEFNNPRNSVSSLLAEGIDEQATKLMYFEAYGLYTTDDTLREELNTFSKMFEFLKDCGFNIPFYKVMKLIKKEDFKPVTIGMMEYLAENVKEQCGVLNDGVVVTINSLEKFRALGSKGKYNLGNKALKLGAWKNKVYLGIIKEIQFGKGKFITGRRDMTPVAIIEPIKTEGGRIVKRVSLVNLDIMKKAKAKVGGTIEFEYVSDMMPHILVYGVNK